MNSSKLERIINSIGRAYFIEYFELLTNSYVPKNQIVKKLMTLERYSETGTKTRVNCAQRILKNNLIQEVLEIIVTSKKIPIATRNKAIRLHTIYM